jgi:protein-S-isoprenylcysteine O-methyltransferase Ste14
VRPIAALGGSSLFFALAPGVVAGVVPGALTGWDSGYGSAWWAPVQLVGAAIIAVCATVLVQAFARFVREGRGTPAPVAPTERLVVGGLYRYVRNPMYVAVVGAIVGQALLLGRPVLLAYAALVGAGMAAFVRGYEEPVLARRYGAAYDEYRRAVPAWRPRRRPWRPDPAHG